MLRLLAPLSLVCLALGLGSCRALKNFDLIELADAKVHNLEALHPRAGRHTYVAALVGDIEYLLLRGVKRTRVGGADAGQGAVPVPENECLANLVALARFDPVDERVASLQVLWCCRVATECPWALSRERAVRELGAAALRLGVGPPAGLAPEATLDDAQAVGRALARVMAALGDGQDAGDDGPLALAEACEGVRTLMFDVAGGRRVLFGLAQLLLDPRRTPTEDDVLRTLLGEVEVRCIGQTLAQALGDEAPRVRAAAVEASVRSGGPGVLAIVLSQLDRESSDEVLAGVLRLVAAEGLPLREEGIDPTDYARAREVWLSQLVRYAVEHPAGSVRVQAMRALAVVADSGPDSLRAEDWEDWWFARFAVGAGAPAGEGLGW